MDALIYTVMSGAERLMRSQQVHANNLANLETPGYRANVESSQARAVAGYGYASRHLNEMGEDAVSSKEGAQRETGRDLDVAIQGPGLFAIQPSAGTAAAFSANTGANTSVSASTGEAYTRSGNFSLDEEGRLMMGRHAVLGEGGPIVLPPHSKLEIAADGLISILPPGQTELQPVDRLKLVKPEFSALRKNEAGLLVARDGQPLEADESVRVGAGRLEASNVSAVESMVQTLSLSRDFEMQMRLFKAADAMAEAGNRLVRE